MGKTSPLSGHALDALGSLSREPQPRQQFNSGVCQLLEGRGLAEVFTAPTPYKTRKGLIQYLRITDAGKAALEASKA